MSKIFRSVRGKSIKRNSFDLSHEKKLSLNMGDLVPILCEEVLPGDTFQLNSEVMMRLAPLVAPIMHRVNVYTHYFFVPNRIVWNEWEDFITGGERGDSAPVFPRVSDTFNELRGKFSTGSLADYLGAPMIPSSSDNEIMEVNLLPFRAYTEIYNEYYRDQNLQDPIEYPKSSGIFDEGGDGIAEIFELRKRAWEKDYFTSALPWAQKGGEVTLPYAESAPVVSSGSPIQLVDDDGFAIAETDLVTDGSGQVSTNMTGGERARFGDLTGLKTDLSQATATTVNDLRKAFQLQKWLERNARSGSRYVESLLAHFGVRSSDARHQRPEYLGGGRTPIVISEVLQTSETSDESAQGTMAGHGIAVGNTHRFRRFFEEHGYVIGIMSVVPRSAYSQGLPRLFSKFDKFDYFWPEFAHLGEQEIKNKELYLGDDGENDETFGYTPRYSEYKYRPSTVHGDFKDDLEHWHMSRYFANRPKLNNRFIESDPTHRIFAVEDPSEHKLWCQVYHNFKAIRPIPVWSEPGLIDH